MIALVPVRGGVLPVGAGESIAECSGRVIVAGSGTATVRMAGASEVHTVELGPFEPARWVSALAPIIESCDDSGVLVLPHSPDGRDLAPRLAWALDRPLFAGAVEVSPVRVDVARHGGLDVHEHRPDGPFVATLFPGTRDAPAAVDDPDLDDPVTARPVEIVHDTSESARPRHRDARVIDVLPPDLRTMELAEATRIVGGGAGLESAERFAQLDRLAAAIGGVSGATRVISDRGWVRHERQIGTSGVVVDPDLYLSFGVSGAVQHTSGLGTPDHVISVNTDPHCPMMAMSDLAIVSDANATLDGLLALLDPAGADD